MRRREFITLLGGAAATGPLAARAQTSLPVVGYLAQGAPEGTGPLTDAVREGLGKAGFVEGKDYAAEFRWARGDADQLPRLAVDLVQRRVAMIVALDTVAAARAAKTATAEIPVLFTVGADPVEAGLVGSLNHPGGNVTGISTMSTEIAPKWVGLLRELLPAAKRFALLVNYTNGEVTKSMISGAQDAVLPLGLQTEVVFASSERDIDSALRNLGSRAQVLLIQPDILFRRNFGAVAASAMREKLLAIASDREFPRAGGLMSYGSSFVDAHRDVGVYAGRILKGERPGDLPVQRSTKFEFVVNLKAAKEADVEIPATMLARADEVIE
jgi:putative tryptophan/tyrosine transport system substrate-binding protein